MVLKLKSWKKSSKVAPSSRWPVFGFWELVVTIQSRQLLIGKMPEDAPAKTGYKHKLVGFQITLSLLDDD
jgi:hypothetical protein